MKRPIEFRGKRVDNGEWVYGDLVHDAISAYSTMVKVGIRQGGYYPDEVNPDTIGQYTGLKDRNGVKIFEGDCISIDKTKPTILNNRFTVAYSGDAMFVLLNNTGKSGVWGTIARAIELEYRFGYIYVVGNIHESGGGEG